MIFRNDTEEKIKCRLDNGFLAGNIQAYKWVTLKVGDTIELQDHYGLALGLTEVDKKEKKKEIPKETIKEKPNNNKSYESKLLAIKGCGHKTVSDIVQMFPTEESIKDFIKSGQILPLRDDIADQITKVFG